MNRKMRIVCKVVEVEITSPNSGQTYKHCVFQEVYTSTYKSDCDKWIAIQRKHGNTDVLKIFVEE